MSSNITHQIINQAPMIVWNPGLKIVLSRKESKLKHVLSLLVKKINEWAKIRGLRKAEILCEGKFHSLHCLFTGQDQMACALRF